MTAFKYMVVAALAALALSGPAVAQQNPAAAPQAQTIKRTPLQRFDVPGTNYVTVIGIAEIAPNILIGRHTHPGPESGYVLSGSFILYVDGQKPLTLTAGQSYKIAPHAVHDAKSGPDGAKVIATYVVEKGKPLATPAK